MASQTKSCGLGQTIDRGHDNWLSPTNIYASDDARAYVGLQLDELTDYLWATTFGFTIPAGATIDGVKVYIERRSNRATAIRDDIVQLIKAGSRQGNNKASGTAWPTTDAYASYGGAADMWGLSLTPAQVNASNFGVVLTAYNAWYEGNAYAYCDHIYIIVYYTEAPSTNIKINIGDSWKEVTEIKINIGDSWKTVTKIQINIGDAWKTVFG